MLTIEIDFDVWKELTRLRGTESVTYNDVLREVLRLGPGTATDAANCSGAWTVKGVTFPEGTEFLTQYKGQKISGRVEGGALVIDGKRYDSPSAAAMSVTGFNVNGWRFWTCKRPGDPSFASMEAYRK